MARTENYNNGEHIIDITSGSGASSSSSSQERPYSDLDARLTEAQPSVSVRDPVNQPSVSTANVSNSRNSSFIRRGNGQRRSPLNSGLWISVELVITVSQIIASVVVLSLSRDEHPHAPLLVWIVAYASGCVATLPHLYWRFQHRNQASEQDSPQPPPNPPESSLPVLPNSNNSSSFTRTLEVVDHRADAVVSINGQSVRIVNARVKVLMAYFKMALDCFFVVWFVIGIVWIFGDHSSSSEAPNMYRLCIVFLVFSCIGYAVPFILCTTICCCLPCIIAVLGFREDQTQNRGATQESISSLLTYKFKIMKNKFGNDKETNSGIEGVVAAGTGKEQVLSGEDAVCCICLSKYANNDVLRELPCCHFFHKDCVDKWLKINALCPLCKIEVGVTVLSSNTGERTTIQTAAAL